MTADTVAVSEGREHTLQEWQSKASSSISAAQLRHGTDRLLAVSGCLCLRMRSIALLCCAGTSAFTSGRSKGPPTTAAAEEENPADVAISKADVNISAACARNLKVERNAQTAQCMH